MLSALRLYLWIAPNLLLFVCLLWMFHRKLHRQHAFFAAYLAVQLTYFVAGFLGDFLASRDLASRTTYLWILIAGLLLSAVVEMRVLYELAVALILSRLKRAIGLRSGLRWMSGALVLLGVILAASLAATSTERLINISQMLNVVVYFIALGLLLAIILLTTVLSIPWRSLHAGIALGLGIAAAGELAGAGALSLFPKNKTGYIAADLIRMSAFHVSALIWLIYLLLPEKASSDRASSLSVVDLESHSEKLRRMVQG